MLNYANMIYFFRNLVICKSIYLNVFLGKIFFVVFGIIIIIIRKKYFI